MLKLSGVMTTRTDASKFYGIWGDENGDDGPKAVIGEASISMATFCFGDSVNGNSGHGETDVLYIAFTGKDAVPGASAAWDANSATEFESSIQSLGDKLTQRIGGGSGNAPSSSNSSSPATTLKTSTKSGGSTATKSQSAGAPTSTCSWAGHCAGRSSFASRWRFANVPQVLHARMRMIVLMIWFARVANALSHKSWSRGKLSYNY